MQTQPIYINLFGTGVRYWLCELKASVFDEMERLRIAKNAQWENLLFDFGFLERFGYKHWSELSTRKEQVGLLLDSMNRIEIKQSHKIISRFQASELTGGDTLFQLHNILSKRIVIQSDEVTKRFVLMHFEKGLMGKFLINAEDFRIGEIVYETKSIYQFQFLANIHYKSSVLEKIKDDSLTTASLVLWEK